MSRFEAFTKPCEENKHFYTKANISHRRTHSNMAELVSAITPKPGHRRTVSNAALDFQMGQHGSPAHVEILRDSLSSNISKHQPPTETTPGFLTFISEIDRYFATNQMPKSTISDKSASRVELGKLQTRLAELERIRSGHEEERIRLKKTFDNHYATCDRLKVKAAWLKTETAKLKNMLSHAEDELEHEQLKTKQMAARLSESRPAESIASSSKKPIIVKKIGKAVPHSRTGSHFEYNIHQPRHSRTGTNNIHTY